MEPAAGGLAEIKASLTGMPDRFLFGAPLFHIFCQHQKNQIPNLNKITQWTTEKVTREKDQITFMEWKTLKSHRCCPGSTFSDKHPLKQQRSSWNPGSQGLYNSSSLKTNNLIVRRQSPADLLTAGKQMWASLGGSTVKIRQWHEMYVKMVPQSLFHWTVWYLKRKNTILMFTFFVSSIWVFFSHKGLFIVC